jgi:hypothetical protein
MRNDPEEVTTMAEPTGQPDESGWLVPPPGPGGVSLFIAVAEDANLTPELREAIETLVRLTSTDESVQGYAQPQTQPTSCPRVRLVTPTTCPILHTCNIAMAPASPGR